MEIMPSFVDLDIQPVITELSPIVKIVGVGGCGGNVVQHVYDSHVNEVSYAICNTDRKALFNSTIPVKIQLGEGLGAGGDPEVGLRVAEQSSDDLQRMFNDGTQMAFITAGMGKGTGTGAAPFVAELAKTKGILTVGFVCLPPEIDGEEKVQIAMKGVDKMRKSVDAIIVVDTQRIFDLYSNLPIDDAFDKANDLMADAAKAVADIVNCCGKINIDMADVRTVLKDSGDVIMAYGKASGENRAIDALLAALDSPLVQCSCLAGAKAMLLNIMYSSQNKIMGDEHNAITSYLRNKLGVDSKTKIHEGLMFDESLGDALSITIMATGLVPDQKRKKVPLDQWFGEPKQERGFSFDLTDGDMTEEEELVPAYQRRKIDF